MTIILKRITALLTTAMALLLLPFAADADWFDEIRDGDDKEALYRTLYYMPKGGDLHNHLSGAVFAEWWYELALAQQERGYEYYTKVRISNCRTAILPISSSTTCPSPIRISAASEFSVITGWKPRPWTQFPIRFQSYR